MFLGLKHCDIMISGGDFLVFIVAVIIVITFFVIMVRFVGREEQDPGDSESDPPSTH